MLIIGLTGSIAMGKSSACKYLAGKGLPVFSADEVVHELYRGAAVTLIGEAFPGAIIGGEVDRELLSKQLVGRPDNLAKLEALIHPLVREKRLEFIRHELHNGAESVILDIPLLFEKHLEHTVDVILLVTASREVQRQRAMKRANMSREKFDMIRSHQMNEADKRLRADFTIDTSGPFEQTHARLDSILESLHNWPQKAAKASQKEML